MPSCQYRKSHCGDKTVVRSSYLHNRISYAGKMTSVYWISLQNILGELGPYHGCWCPGSLYHQVINHSIIIIWDKWVLRGGTVLTTCATPVLRNDGKYNCDFMLPKLNSEQQGQQLPAISLIALGNRKLPGGNKIPNSMLPEGQLKIPPLWFCTIKINSILLHLS